MPICYFCRKGMQKIRTVQYKVLYLLCYLCFVNIFALLFRCRDSITPCEFYMKYIMRIV